MTIYHVTEEWHGDDLLSFVGLVDGGYLDMTLEETMQSILGKWPDLGTARKAEEYLDTDGRMVHCHATLAEAIDYREKHLPGGIILAIDADDLRVEVGTEYPHPVVRDVIPAASISVSTRGER